MEDLIKRCKETNAQLSEIQNQMYELVKDLLKRLQEETRDECVEFEMDERPLYADPETGMLECYYGAKVVDDKLLMTKDDGWDEINNEYNEDWRYCDAVNLDKVYECIINTVERYYADWMKEDYVVYLDYEEGEN